MSIGINGMVSGYNIPSYHQYFFKWKNTNVKAIGGIAVIYVIMNLQDLGSRTQYLLVGTVHTYIRSRYLGNTFF